MTRAGSLCSGVGGRHLRACDWDVRTADRGVLVALVEQFHYSHSAANTASSATPTALHSGCHRRRPRP